MKKYDLIITGGGLSGVCAALSAARAGLSVLLVEKSGCLGGAAANCYVMPFMPYFTSSNGQTLRLSDGIFSEIVQSLKQMSPGTDDQNFNDEDLKLLLNRMVLKDGVDLLLHAYVFDAEVSGGHVSAICAATKSGKLRLEADFFIDASGDADLAVLCGCPTHLGRSADNLCQPMTLCFRMVNVDVAAFNKMYPQDIDPLYQQLQRAGKLKNPREDVLVFNYPTVDGVLHFNSTRIVKRNPVDAFDLTQAELEVREQVHELVSFMKDSFAPFQHASLMSTAPEIGVRESRMIVGEHILTAAEIMACTKFPDAIAAGNYDIDIHNPEGSGTSHYYFPAGAFYTIPYRSLIPQNADNLLVAGRCISSDHEAQASYRIMPICATLGQAAGTAAALAVKSGVDSRQVDIPLLQKTLRDNGAFIG